MFELFKFLLEYIGYSFNFCETFIFIIFIPSIIKLLLKNLEVEIVF